MEGKPYFILFWWLKVIFDTSRLFIMVKHGIFKKKQVSSSILKVWQIWLQIAKHTPRGRSFGKKPYFILFWWLKVIFDTSRLFIMVKYGIFKKKSKSLAPFWRFDRSDFKLQNTPPGGGHLEEKPYFILFWWLKVILYTSRLFIMVKHGIFKKKASL